MKSGIEFDVVDFAPALMISVDKAHDASIEGTMNNTGRMVIKALTLIALLSFAKCAFSYTTTINGITWEYAYVEGGVSLSNGSRSVIDRSLTGTIEIPEYIDGLPVVEIGSDAFGSCRFSNIVIPSSVKKIDNYAFYGCTSLETIEFPDSVVEFGKSVFTKCETLRVVKMPKDITTIPDASFCDCWNLEELVLPDSYTSIGAHAFQHCYKLQTIVIPVSLRTIGAGAFRGSSITIIVDEGNPFFTVENRILYDKDKSRIYYCPCDQQVSSISATVVEIGPSAFEDCTNVVELILPSTITNIGDSAFYDCTSLTHVTLPPNFSTLAPYVFSGCSKLESLIVPEGVRTIGSYAVAGCTSLKYLAIPSSVEDITRMFAWGNYGAEVISFKGTPPVGLSTISKQRIGQIIYNQKYANEWHDALSEAGLTQSEEGVEVDGKNFLVPLSWTNNIPRFAVKFGNDFSSALMKPTGKRDACGNALLVWEDYVAGTDPTDVEDVLHADITLVNGVPHISYMPELPILEKAKRNYTIYGKERLQDGKWSVVTGDAAKYNFFKVMVEMK